MKKIVGAKMGVEYVENFQKGNSLEGSFSDFME